MNKQNILQNLGLCKRANKIVSGEAQVIDKIRKNKVYIVFLASDSAKNTTKRITDKTKYYNIRLINNFNTEELNKAIGSNNRKVIAINDINFSRMIINKLER